MSDANRRLAFLNEMGLGPVWSQRTHASAFADEVVNAEPRPESVPHQMDAEMLPSSAWHEPNREQSANSVVLPMGNAPVPAVGIARMDWDELTSAVASCTQCTLCKSRTKTVFGVGDQKARWLFVGEGPGRNEDQQGLPFVGPAGKLLDNMLIAMGLKRGENTYIANIVKCRPTDATRRDRPPAAEEADACMPYLERQIALIQPTVIVALGKTAALSLLKLDPATPVSKLRGKVHHHADIPLIVTYHPAYLLRSLADKSKTWADLCLAMQTYAGSGK